MHPFRLIFSKLKQLSRLQNIMKWRVAKSKRRVASKKGLRALESPLPSWHAELKLNHEAQGIFGILIEVKYRSGQVSAMRKEFCWILLSRILTY